ncbi:MAG: hypothetical protein AB7K52_10385 [Phycisphaerales bacterium]
MGGARWADIPGQTLVPIQPGRGRGVRVQVRAAGTAPPLPAAGAERWAKLVDANPRMFDGPILAFESFDGASGVIDARHDRFARVAVQDETLDLGVRLLGVKGLIVARDQRGATHVLIARRGRQTRIYADMWEIAPAGGIDPPGADADPGGMTELNIERLVATLMEESEEELGIDLHACARGTPEPVALVHDELARSVEIIMRVDWREAIDPSRLPGTCPASGRGVGGGWEYSDAAWLAQADARVFDERSREAIVGPMRAVLRWMGWC